MVGRHGSAPLAERQLRLDAGHATPHSRTGHAACLDTTYRLTHLYADALKTGLNELMQIYTIKIVAGARGRVPAIVGYDLTRLRRAKVLFIGNIDHRLHDNNYAPLVIFRKPVT